MRDKCGSTKNQGKSLLPQVRSAFHLNEMFKSLKCWTEYPSKFVLCKLTANDQVYYRCVFKNYNFSFRKAFPQMIITMVP